MWCKGRIISCLDLLAVCLVILLRMLLANSLRCQGVVACQQPQSLSCRAAPPSISLYPYQDLFLPRGKTWHLSLLNIFMFLIYHSSCFLGIPEYQPFPQATPWSSPHSCVICKHDKSAPHCLLQSLVKTGPHTDSHGIPHTVWMLHHHLLTQTMQLSFLFT